MTSNHNRSSGVNVDCFFCNLPEERILARADHFVVSLCLGPLVEGHVIIVPSDHCFGLAEVSSLELLELTRIRRTLKIFLEQEYDLCLFFEHGFHERAGEGMYHSHAHMHVVPAGVDISDIVEERNYPFTETDYSANMEVQGEYLFYEGPHTDPRFYWLTLEPEPQFVRRMIATAIGMPLEQANWKGNPRYATMRAARERLKGCMNKFMDEGGER